jgi:thiamine pyrophosphate-dependent acetolactate synthase large subunit-like protein
MRILSDTATAIPALTEACKTRLKSDAKAAARIKERKAAIAVKHKKQWDEWQKIAQKHAGDSPMHESRMAAEVWKAIEGEDWVLTAGTLKTWALRTWNFDKPYRHPGRELGTATQIGMSLGVALAHKGSGKLVVDLQPDGDLMYDLGALWVAAKYEIPILVVMYNNRAYFNDWAHQIQIAENRGTDVGRANIGMDLADRSPTSPISPKGSTGTPKSDRGPQGHRSCPQARHRPGQRASRRWSISSSPGATGMRRKTLDPLSPSQARAGLDGAATFVSVI